MGWSLAITVAVVIAVILLVARRRRISIAEGMVLLGGVPLGPKGPGVAWMYGGRDTPPDPDVRKTPPTVVDTRPGASLPPGVKRLDDFD